MENDLNGLGTEVRNTRKLKGFTLQGLADAVSVSKGMIWQIEDGRVKPGIDLINKIGKVLDRDFSNYVRTLHLTPVKKKSAEVTGNATMISEMPIQEEIDESGSKFINLHNGQYLMIVPLVEEYAYAGFLAGYKDPEYIKELPKHSIVVDKYHRGRYYSFRVVGDSMDDGSKESKPDGSIVTGRDIGMQHWRSKFHMHKYKDYIIVHKTSGVLVKRISSHDVENGIITCRSLNPDKDTYPDFELHLDDVSKIMNITNVTIPQ